jgi:hypothetical protein
LKIKGLLGGVGWWRTISASILREFGNIRGLQHPWRASTDLLGLQSAERNHAGHCHRRDVQMLRGLPTGIVTCQANCTWRRIFPCLLTRSNEAELEFQFLCAYRAVK